MSFDNTPEQGLNQPQTAISEPISRREFLKQAVQASSAALASRALPKTIVDAISENTTHPADVTGQEKNTVKNVINMEPFFLSSDENKNALTFSWEKFRIVHPKLVGKENDQIRAIENNLESPIQLDFSGLADKKITFPKQTTRVYRQNIDPSEYSSSEGLSDMQVGLILKGSFILEGQNKTLDDQDSHQTPTMLGDGLDRVIHVVGKDDSSVLKISNLRFQNLSMYAQSPEGDDQTSAPAFISADDANLYLERVIIESDEISNYDEETGQVGRGVILNNSTDKKLILAVANSAITGVPWDGVVSNGYADVFVNKSLLSQQSHFRHKRGTGVAATFNKGDGVVVVNESTIDYAKGVNWFGQSGESGDGSSINIIGSDLDCSYYAFTLDRNKRGKIRDNTIRISHSFNNLIPDHYESVRLWNDSDDETQGGIWIYAMGNQFDIDRFDFNISRQMEDSANYISLIRIDDYKRSNPEDLGKKIDHMFPNLMSFTLVDEDQSHALSFTKLLLSKWLSECSAESDLDGSRIHIIYDTQNNRLGIIANKYNQDDPPSPSKIFWFPYDY